MKYKLSNFVQYYVSLSDKPYVICILTKEADLQWLESVLNGEMSACFFIHTQLPNYNIFISDLLQ